MFSNAIFVYALLGLQLLSGKMIDDVSSTARKRVHSHALYV